MPLYTGLMDLGIAMPIPVHALTPGAEEARESMRRIGAEKRVERQMSKLVTVRGHARIEPYDGPVIPTAARSTMRHAESHGFETTMIPTAVGCSLHGIHRERGVGFAAHWHRGKTSGGTWHERDVRWSLVDISSRPIGVDAKTKLTKAKHRHDAGDRTRLVLVAAPYGVPCNITEIEKRIGPKPEPKRKRTP